MSVTNRSSYTRQVGRYLAPPKQVPWVPTKQWLAKCRVFWVCFGVEHQPGAFLFIGLSTEYGTLPKDSSFFMFFFSFLFFSHVCSFR